MKNDRIGKGQMQEAARSGVPVLTMADFNSTPGEKVVGGGNVLVVDVNSVTGPYTVTKIETKRLNKTYKPVKVWSATAPDGTEYSMPAATSFVAKATEARLAVGETFLLLRNEDYRARGKDCASFAINITSRAPKGQAKRKVDSVVL